MMSKCTNLNEIRVVNGKVGNGPLESGSEKESDCKECGVHLQGMKKRRGRYKRRGTARGGGEARWVVKGKMGNLKKSNQILLQPSQCNK